MHSLPIWLQALLTHKFFNACVLHEHAKKNEKNIFCFDCSLGICPHCLSSHSSHKLLQIRRYVYHDVIRLDDATKLIDCAFVQSYTTNSAKVVFLKQRPQTRNFRGSSGNLCSTCDRSLQDPYLFCSLSCKIDYLMKTEGGVSRNLLECNFSAWDDGLMMTPDSVLELGGSNQTSSGSDGGGVEEGGRSVVASTATTEFVKKKRSSLTAAYRAACRPACWPGTISETSGSLLSRRKGTPQRAPLY
ncbi:uncharacterized protein LOC111807359 [Cucurbita pepo subsp. pepo]|uniref:uncharacterized protein LOC111807359 n=1 Tax=Cucurbita pepo subsp. pepo TaxID=3664 RepID=UPI000C9D4529|nr:uncharacterized protein LOC111807359 [Cucurbita pepo subsp. pepo]